MARHTSPVAQAPRQPHASTLDKPHLHIRAALAGLAFYLVGALYLLARVIPSFGSAIPGTDVATLDGWQNTWNIWWTHLALSQGQNPYFTTMLFHPAGQPLTLHTLNITNSLMTMPVQLIAGPIAAYNTALILGFVLTGFAAYLLAVSLIGRRDIAIAVGAIVTFGPFHIAKLADGHLSWVTFFWVVFYLWCTLHALDTGSNHWRIAAGVVLGGATLTSFYYPLFSFIFTVLLLLTRLPAAIRGQTWRRELASAAMIGVIAVAIASPLLIPAIQEYRAQPAQVAVEDTGPASRWDRETSTYSADLIDIVFPSPFHALWGTWANQTHQALRYGWFYTITPGIGVLILAAAGVALAGRRARPLAVLVIVLWVLMLGPELRIAGVSTGITLPYDLLRAIPGMSLGHRPNHLVIFMLPLLAVLAGFGMQELLQRGRTGKSLLVLLAILIGIEYLVLPMPALPLERDPVVSELRGQPGAVIELPTLQRNIPPMIHQLIHGRPIVGGYLARPPANDVLTTTVPWVRQLSRLRPEDLDDIIEPQPDDARQAFSFYDIRTIVVRKNDLQRGDNGRLQDILGQLLPGITPAHQSAQLDAYNIEPVATARPFLFLGSGWNDLERSDTNKWRWMSGESALWIVNPEQVTRLLTIGVVTQSYQVARTLTVTLDGAPAATFTIEPQIQTIRLPLMLTPGQHTLHLTSPATKEPPPAERLLSLMVLNIAIVPN